MNVVGVPAEISNVGRTILSKKFNAWEYNMDLRKKPEFKLDRQVYQVVVYTNYSTSNVWNNRC